MGDWSFLGRLLENAQEHSTVIGKVNQLLNDLQQNITLYYTYLVDSFVQSDLQ